MREGVGVGVEDSVGKEGVGWDDGQERGQARVWARTRQRGRKVGWAEEWEGMGERGSVDTGEVCTGWADRAANREMLRERCALAGRWNIRMVLER